MPEQLVRAEGLTEDMLAAIEGLAEACDRAEGLRMRLNWPTLRRRSPRETNDFLYYDGDRLIGYLGLYQFTSEEAEASAMTHPDHRRRGIFKQLLGAAQEELRARETPRMLFFGERKSPALGPVAHALGAAYRHSEYLMTVEPDGVRLGPAVPGLALRLAERADLPMLGELDEEAFDVPARDNHFLEHVLNDPTQRLWTVTLDGRPIGKLQGRPGDGESYIYGFAITPALRGRGYGRAALSEAMRRLLAERRQKISLEVMTDNEQALGLYQSRGFKMVTAYDYYGVQIKG